jgi:glycosyltransferase involved in cell wall biosynthesis
MLLRELGSFRPDIAHFHNTFPLLSPAVYYACQREGVPVVQTLHNYRLLCAAATLFRSGAPCEECPEAGTPWPGVLHGCYRGSRPQTAVVAAMLLLHRTLRTWDRQVDRYIALTEFARRKFVEGGLPESKIIVKPNFVDPAPQPASGRGGYALFVGRLSPEKGVGTLLDAWRRLTDVPLLVAGDGPLRRDVEAAAAVLGARRLLFVGQQDHRQVLALMRDARFLVFPSAWYESFPLVVVEAFACGLPVVAGRLGAAAEVVGAGRTGLHFDPADARDLAAKAAWLWARPAESRRMGREARAEFERSYAAPRNYRILMGLYQGLLQVSSP